MEKMTAEEAIRLLTLMTCKITRPLDDDTTHAVFMAIDALKNKNSMPDFTYFEELSKTTNADSIKWAWDGADGKRRVLSFEIKEVTENE